MNLDYSITSDSMIGLSSAGIPLGNLRCAVQYQGSPENVPLIFSADKNSSEDSGMVMAGKLGETLSLQLHILHLCPNALAMQFKLVNQGETDICLERLVFPELTLDSETFLDKKPLWTLQGAAVGWGQDFAFELKRPFDRDNYLGHLQDAEGGGTPINYFWNASHGLALMHIEPVPQEWYMPVHADGKTITTRLEKRASLVLQAGEQVVTPQVVVSLHEGDFFEPVALYRELLTEQGCAPAQPNPECFEPAWCSWGYEFDVTPRQMLGVIPMLQELGIHWLTLDDRWFDAYGDWRPRADTFPVGIAAIKQMNQQIHSAGMKSQIWWYPLCAEDGDGGYESHPYVVSQVLKDHPDWVVRHADGSVARNNRHLVMLCPALPEVQEYTRRLTEEFIRDWGFDGHKLDNIFTMPACYNPAHHHARPEESIEAFAKVYAIIFETTRGIKGNSVTQICPCGTPLTHSLMPSVDQTVTADPTSSLQIRQRIKFYKALMGPCAAVFADHVELSDNGVDFASEIGAGGVPATKFVYPDDAALQAKLQEYWALPEEKQKVWKQWFELYHKHQPAAGEYLNLYDSVFDVPETHVIRKNRRYYFSFFASHYSGSVKLRGLGKGKYHIQDLVTGQDYGIISVENPMITLQFSGAKLLFADPMED